MGMVLPLQRDLLLNPYEKGLVGSVNVEKEKKEYPQVNKTKIVPILNTLAVTGVLDRGKGVVQQQFAFLALPDNRTIYIDNVIQISTASKIQSLELGTLGILNDSNWVYHNGKRTLYHSDGETVFTATGTASDAAEIKFSSPWYNIDNELGIVCLKITGGQKYVANHNPSRGRIEQLFHLNNLENPVLPIKRISKTKRLLAETVLIFYPGQQWTDTRTVPEKCNIIVDPKNSSCYKIMLEDGKTIVFDLKKLDIVVD